MSLEPDLKPGLQVRTFDRRALGVIQEVSGGRVLLKPRLRGRYWLADGLVQGVSEDWATLHIDSSVVSRYRQPAPRGRSRMRALEIPVVCGGLAGVVLALLGAF